MCIVSDSAIPVKTLRKERGKTIIAVAKAVLIAHSVNFILLLLKYAREKMHKGYSKKYPNAAGV
jgi:hypothetical protein